MFEGMAAFDKYSARKIVKLSSQLGGIDGSIYSA